MKHLIEFSLEEDQSIIFEVDESRSDFYADRIGIQQEVIQKSKESFDTAISKIQPIANAIITKVRSLKEPADEVQVKFGLKMSAEMGAIITSSNIEGNYEITLKWTNSKG